jgi:hypothetical protein
MNKSNKVEIKLDILNLMHIYATVNDFIKLTGKEKCGSNFNYMLLNKAFKQLEDEISKFYTEEHGDICAETYEKLEKEFNGQK